MTAAPPRRRISVPQAGDAWFFAYGPPSWAPGIWAGVVWPGSRARTPGGRALARARAAANCTIIHPPIAVDAHKRTVLRRLARRYVCQLPQPTPPPMRFDVMSVYLVPGQEAEIRHFEGMFSL